MDSPFEVLQPPLNVDENTSHPLYPLVRATRDAFITAARGRVEP